MLFKVIKTIVSILFLTIVYMAGLDFARLKANEAIAQSKKCWYSSSELSSQEEVMYFLNETQADPTSTLLIHSYRSGIKWHVLQSRNCK